MKSQRHFIALTLLLAALAALGTIAPATAADPAEDDLIAVLNSDAAKSEKAITCKKLAVYGSAKAVPALKPLLKDEELISWARIALEAIPGPEADAALRDALGEVSGRSLIGVINSLAVRDDKQAVPGLIKTLDTKDDAVAAAALAALGDLGGEQAVAALKKSLSGSSQARRNAAAEGLVYAAEDLMQAGQTDKAAQLYLAVRGADVSKPRKIEATRGAILAQGEAGVPLLVEQLRSDDVDFFRLGLFTARELEGRKVTDAITGELAEASPQHAALLLTLLADRGEPVSTPLVLEQATKGATASRVAAVELLGALGDAEAVGPLFELAGGENEEVAAAAKAALAGLSGEKVDAAIVAQLNDADGNVATAVEIVGRRRILSAEGALLKLLESDDPEVRQPALKALGEVISSDKLDALIAQVAGGADEQSKPAALKALRAAAVRMKDREATAKKLVAAMADEPVEVKVDLLGVLGAMGGPTALKAIHKSGTADQKELQDAATRLLGEWLHVEAAPALLEMATTKDHGYRVRALRGYLRLARQFAESDAQRAAMCLKAFEVAQRDEERELALDVLKLYPSAQGMKAAAQLADGSVLKDKAQLTAEAIAAKLIGGKVDAEQVLKMLDVESGEVEIVKASYGAGDKQADVTEALRRHVKGSPLIVLGNYNEALGGDPVPRTPKKLTVEYKLDGKPGKATFEENARILLPKP